MPSMTSHVGFRCIFTHQEADPISAHLHPCGDVHPFVPELVAVLQKDFRSIAGLARCLGGWA